MSEKRKLLDLELDVRIRDRLLANGTLKPEEIEAHLAELPDLASQAESMGIEQPALVAIPQPPSPEPALNGGEGLE